MAEKEVLSKEGIETLLIRIGDLLVGASFGILKRFPVNMLLRTSINDWCIYGIPPRE